MKRIYNCDKCENNKGFWGNASIEFCEVCSAGHCIHCTYRDKEHCEDYKEKTE